MTCTAAARRLAAVERAILPLSDDVDAGRLAEARERLIDEVNRVAAAHGIGPAADTEAVLAQLDRALEKVRAARRRAWSRP
jgi:GTP cyclohydrolase III